MMSPLKLSSLRSTPISSERLWQEKKPLTDEYAHISEAEPASLMAARKPGW